MTTLQHAVVLVTGANGGLGTEFVRQALDRGAAKVYATARTPEDWDDERVVPVALDVTDPASVAAAAARTADTTVLVNNAGIGLVVPTLLDTDPEDFRRVFETNVLGLLCVTRALAPALRRARGAVVNVASVASWRARGVLAAYGATKAAVWSMTDSMRHELQPDGVQVLGLSLAFTDTPMTAGLDVPKGSPVDVVRQAYDGLEAGALEVLADQVTRDVRGALSEIVTAA